MKEEAWKYVFSTDIINPFHAGSYLYLKNEFYFHNAGYFNYKLLYL